MRQKTIHSKNTCFSQKNDDECKQCVDLLFELTQNSKVLMRFRTVQRHLAASCPNQIQCNAIL